MVNVLVGVDPSNNRVYKWVGEFKKAQRQSNCRTLKKCIKFRKHKSNSGYGFGKSS